MILLFLIKSKESFAIFLLFLLVNIFIEVSIYGKINAQNVSFPVVKSI